MSTNALVRRFDPAEWSTYRDLRLQALADSPDAFGSTLALEQGRPASEWERRLSDGAGSASDLPLVGEVQGAAAGLAWARADPAASSEVHIYQMWVNPEHRGRGLGRLLLRTAIAWARERNALAVCLGVTCGDTPATALYRAEGFMPTGLPEPLRPDSTLLAQPMKLSLQSSRRTR